MAAISGQVTVTTAGTAVQFSSTQLRIDGPLLVGALEGNTGNVYVGNDGAGDVTSSNGFELGPGDRIVIPYVGDLYSLWGDAASDGDKLCWHRGAVMSVSP